MKCEEQRLRSFEDKWAVVDVTPESLAENGFFCIDPNRVQCSFCNVIISDWTVGDKPVKEHIRNNPKCPFLLGLDVGNISSCTKKKYVNPLTELYIPKHPRMADIKKRKLTFVDWKHRKPEPELLAECGFYYSGIRDVVVCFFCNGTLGNWEPDDDPWSDHLKFFPKCIFSIVSKFVRKSPKNPARDVLLCTLCMEKERSMTFQPCGHLISCCECSKIVTNCPICRSHIYNKIKTYLC